MHRLLTPTDELFLQQRSEIAYRRLILALLRVQLLELRAGFNPNQPRVPAGLPEGGQWTDADGPFGSRPLDLADEERNGGHAIRFHVGKSDRFLIARVRQKQSAVRWASRIPRIGRIVRKATLVREFEASSFPSLSAANKLVRSTLSRNEAIVSRVADGDVRGRVEVRARFRSRVGRIASVRGLKKSPPRVREARSVVVIIRHDPNIQRGYRVITAFVD